MEEVEQTQPERGEIIKTKISFVPDEEEKAYILRNLTKYDDKIKYEEYHKDADYIGAAKKIQARLQTIQKGEASLTTPALNIFTNRSHFSSCGQYLLAISTSFFFKIRLSDYKIVIKQLIPN
jgi:hypothetical protein